LGVATSVVLAGCSNGVTSGAGSASTPKPDNSSVAVAAEPSARVLFAPGDPEAGIAPDQKLKVLAARGRLTDVSVKGPDGAAVAGAFSADGSVWTSSSGPLDFGASYSATATATDAQGRTSTARSQFQVRNADILKASFGVGGGRTVGIGMPVIVRFNRTPSDQAAVERALSVQASPTTTGSWAWISPREVHWRPKNYWAAGTEVTVRADLEDVAIGNDQWGAASTQTSFRIGGATIYRVGVDTYQLQVIQNGKLIRTIPITTGKAGFLTRNGIKVIMSKERYRVMDSTTIDIPEGSSDSYRLKVSYAMRLTNSGEFLHAAPWSVGSQGRRNVSHGCTGMSTANAAWLYSITKPGDVVEYTGSPRPMTLSNGYGDWNLTWDAWTNKSALT